jgi:hypothetical protein
MPLQMGYKMIHADFDAYGWSEKDFPLLEKIQLIASVPYDTWNAPLDPIPYFRRVFTKAELSDEDIMDIVGRGFIRLDSVPSAGDGFGGDVVVELSERAERGLAFLAHTQELSPTQTYPSAPDSIDTPSAEDSTFREYADTIDFVEISRKYESGAKARIGGSHELDQRQSIIGLLQTAIGQLERLSASDAQIGHNDPSNPINDAVKTMMIASKEEAQILMDELSNGTPNISLVATTARRLQLIPEIGGWFKAEGIRLVELTKQEARKKGLGLAAAGFGFIFLHDIWPQIQEILGAVYTWLRAVMSGL